MLCFMFRYEGPGATRKFFNLTERLRRALKNKIKKRKVLRKFRATHPWSTAGSNYHLRLLEACWSNLKHLTLGGRGGGLWTYLPPPIHQIRSPGHTLPQVLNPYRLTPCTGSTQRCQHYINVYGFCQVPQNIELLLEVT